VARSSNHNLHIEQLNCHSPTAYKLSFIMADPEVEDVDGDDNEEAEPAMLLLVSVMLPPIQLQHGGRYAPLQTRMMGKKR
jgi:hypothetical protein